MCVWCRKIICNSLNLFLLRLFIYLFIVIQRLLLALISGNTSLVPIWGSPGIPSRQWAKQKPHPLYCTSCLIVIFFFIFTFCCREWEKLNTLDCSDGIFSCGSCWVGPKCQLHCSYTLGRGHRISVLSLVVTVTVLL